VKLIDLFGFDADEVRRRWPATYQWVLERVKPERDNNNVAPATRNWWLFGEAAQGSCARALVGLSRYIATVETAKHRVFQFLDAAIAPDNKLIAIALDDAYFLGVLSSRVHVVMGACVGGSWLVSATTRATTSPAASKPSPSPSPRLTQQARIRDLAEQIDAHRKRVLAAHDST
jgi:hypothetical protein